MVSDQEDADREDNAEEGEALLFCAFWPHILLEEEELDDGGKAEGQEGQEEAEMAGLWSFVRPRPGEDGHHGEEDEETNVKDKHGKLDNGEE